MNLQAEQLNTIIKEHSPACYALLSEKGKGIYFPKEGILAQTAEAAGKRINATIGIAVRDDGSPMRLMSIEKNVRLRPELVFSYAPSFGRKDLREKWKAMMLAKNPQLQQKQISLPVVTSALTHGLSTAAYLFADPGDSIILPDLFWGNYKLMFTNGFGANLSTFNMFLNNSFDTGALAAALKGKGRGKRILLLNFPNNPSGYTVTVAERKKIVEYVHEAAKEGNNILVLIDDAYFGLCYEEGIETQSLFSYLCDIHENVVAVKLDGPTKEDYVWGFRVGFLTFGMKNGNKMAYDALEAKTAGTIRGCISNSPHISQSLLLDAYSSPSYSEEKHQTYLILKERYLEMKNVFKAHREYSECFTPLPFNSGYFMCVRLAQDINAEKARKILLERYDTGVISTGNLIRLAFSAVRKSDIADLIENVFLACKDARAAQ